MERLHRLKRLKKLKLLTINFTVYGALSFFSLTMTSPPAASAEDAPFCHDLPEKQKVLQEGQDFLKSSGDANSWVQPGPASYVHRRREFRLVDEIPIEIGEFEYLLSPLGADAKAQINMADLLLQFSTYALEIEPKLLPIISVKRAGTVLSALIRININEGLSK